MKGMGGLAMKEILRLFNLFSGGRSGISKQNGDFTLYIQFEEGFFHEYVFLICFSIVDVMDYIRLHRKIHSQEGSKGSLSKPLGYDKKNFEVSYKKNIAIKSSKSCDFLNSIAAKYTRSKLHV